MLSCFRPIINTTGPSSSSASPRITTIEQTELMKMVDQAYAQSSVIRTILHNSGQTLEANYVDYVIGVVHMTTGYTDTEVMESLKEVLTNQPQIPTKKVEYVLIEQPNSSHACGQKPLVIKWNEKYNNQINDALKAAGFELKQGGSPSQHKKTVSVYVNGRKRRVYIKRKGAYVQLTPKMGNIRFGTVF